MWYICRGVRPYNQADHTQLLNYDESVALLGMRNAIALSQQRLCLTTALVLDALVFVVATIDGFHHHPDHFTIRPVGS